MSDIHVTRHAKKRTKDRVGLSKRLAEKNAAKALEVGLSHAEAKAGLKRYLDYLYLSNNTGNNVRVYHRYVYVFHNRTLVTILPLPTKFYDMADKLQKQKIEDIQKYSVKIDNDFSES